MSSARSSALNARATVLIAAGETGGHIFPALAVAEQLISRGVDVVWLGRPGSLEARVADRNNIPLREIKIAGLRGKGLLYSLRYPFALVMAISQALDAISRAGVTLVLGMGGFVSGPAGIAFCS